MPYSTETSDSEKHIRARLRRFLPKSGPAYELFDTSVMLFVLGLIGYVLTKPVPNTVNTLHAPLIFLTEHQLGLIVTAAALTGLVTAYWTKFIRVGYTTMITATLTISACFAWGWITYSTSPRSLISALLYAWIARRLIRDQSYDQ